MTDSSRLLTPPETVPFSSESGAPIVEQSRAIVQEGMRIESIQVPGDAARQGVVVLRGFLTQPSHRVFGEWLSRFRTLGYTPLLRHAPEAGVDAVALHVMVGVPPEARPRAWINLILFLLTLVSTLFVGSLYADPETAQIETFADLLSPQNLIRGWPFALTLLGILGAHEFGHYFAARFHKVAVTLPYFIPMPMGFGTLGAFIQMKEPVPDRRRLFDIGVAGPLAGLALALPLLFVGLSTSPVIVIPPDMGGILEGNSILYYYAKVWIHGQALPNPITGEDVLMNQVAFAAWIGLLVTALNLLPVGQLDGGHTVYALFGRRAQVINLVTLGFMTILAVAGIEPLQEIFPVLRSVGFFGWFVWLGLIVFLLGPFHPPALDDVTELDNRRRLIGYAVIVIFILTFVPVPFQFLTS
jgi:membrane-associated protease RseP (regulator of RpoE activity)